MKAVAVFQGKVNGVVTFEDYGENVLLKAEIYGLKKNALHGFHIHEAGDLTDPYGKQHGCPGKKERHVGDLGNLETDEKGCKTTIDRR